MIGLIAARGGMGVSSLASNLAASLYNKFQADIILAELTPGQGSLVLDLGVENENGLAEILGMAPAEITRDSVSKQLFQHDAGFKVLAASNHPRDFHLINQVSSIRKSGRTYGCARTLYRSGPGNGPASVCATIAAPDRRAYCPG